MTGPHYAVLAGLKLTEILPSAGIKGIYHHHPAHCSFSGVLPGSEGPLEWVTTV